MGLLSRFRANEVRLSRTTFGRHATLLGLILLLGLALRLYHITTPPYDFLAWRDTQTLMVARNFHRAGMNPFAPAVDWRTTYEVAPTGTVGGAELMVVPYLTAVLYHVFGIQYWVGRVVPIFFAVLGAFYFYKLVGRFYGPVCAAVATLTLTVLPYYLYCGRCQMPESFALAMAFAAFYYYDTWLSTNQTRDFLRAAAFALLMMLGKPQMGVMAIPMAFLTFDRFGWKAFVNRRLYLFAALVGIPFAAYMLWTSYVIIPRTGISFSGPGAFNFRRWLANPQYYRDIAKSVWLWSVTPPVCVLGLVGLFMPRRDSRAYFAHAWLLGAMSLFFLMPGGAAPNGYYQIILEPPFALLAAFPLAACLSGPRLRLVAAAALIGVVAWPFYITARLYRPTHLPDYECGTWIRENTSEDALVLTSSPNPATLYFADRVGWTSWQEHYGKGAVFGRELINKVMPLGASVLAVPVAHEWFDSAYYTDYEGIRDDLYDTFLCHKEDVFTVFFLTQRADLALPDDGCIVFGTLGSRKHLRGPWGPNQTDAAGRPFTTMGPGNRAAIRFVSPSTVQHVVLELSSAVANQTITVGLNGEALGTVQLPVAGEHAELRFEPSAARMQNGFFTLTLEAARWNQHGVSLLLHGLRVQTESQPSAFPELTEHGLQENVHREEDRRVHH